MRRLLSPSSAWVVALLLLLCIGWSRPVAGSVSGSDEWLIATTDVGCTSLTRLDATFDLDSDTTCPNYIYTEVVESNTTTTATNDTTTDEVFVPPVGLSVAISAVDPVAEVLYLLEVEADGNSTITSSPLSNRSLSTRLALDDGVTPLAMTLGLQASGDLTPLLLLTSEPELELISFSPSSGVSTTLLSSDDMSYLFNLSYAVVGVLELNVVAQEVYFVGLRNFGANITNSSGSGNETIYYSYEPTEAELDDATPYLFAYSLATGVGAYLELVDLEDLSSLHYASELGALLFVTSSEVRAATVPSGGLTTSGLDALETLSISTTFGSATTGATSSSLEFTDQIANFTDLYDSARWMPLARQLLLGVSYELVNETLATNTTNATYTTYESYGLVSIDLSISSTDSSAYEATGLVFTDVTQLPLIFQDGLAPPTLTGIEPTYFTPRTALTLTISGEGFAQALIRDSLLCTLQPVLANGTADTAVVVEGTLNDTTTSASGLDQIFCDLPATTVTWSASELLVTVSAMDGTVLTDPSTLEINVTCGLGYSLTNSSCTLCAAGTFSSVLGASSCIQCPSDMTSIVGATSSADCVLADPCDYATDGSNDGWEIPVEVQLQLAMNPVNFTAAVALEFREIISTALNISLDRVSSTTASSVGTSTSVVLVTFEIDPATAVNYATCVATLYSWGENATVHNGWSPAALVRTLEAQLSDSESILYTTAAASGSSALSAAISGGTIVAITSIVDDGISLAQCAKNAAPSLAVFVASIILVACVHHYMPYLHPRHAEAPPTDARPFEQWPTALPIIAFAFDAYFISVIPSDFTLQWVWVGIGIALILAGIAHNLAVMVKYGRPQLTRAGEEVGSSMDKNAVTKYQPSPEAGEDTTTSAAGPNGQAPLVAWRKEHPNAAKMAFVAGALNINALGLMTSELSTRTSVWDLQWDAKRVGSKPFHSMIWWAGLRMLIARQLTMIVLQLGVMASAECKIVVVAPFVAGVLAFFAVAYRLHVTKHLAEPGVLAAARRALAAAKAAEERQSRASRSSSLSGSNSSVGSRASRAPLAGSSRSLATATAGAVAAASAKSRAGESDDEDDAGLILSHPRLPGMAADHDDDDDIDPSGEAAAAAATRLLRLEPLMMPAWQAKKRVLPALAPLAAGSGAAEIAARAAAEAKVLQDIAERAMRAATTQQEVSSAVWLLLDIVGPQEDIDTENMRLVEQFDDHGKPFNPPRYKQYIRRSRLEEAAAMRRAEEEATKRRAEEELARQQAEEDAAWERAQKAAARRRAEQEAADKAAQEAAAEKDRRELEQARAAAAARAEAEAAVAETSHFFLPTGGESDEPASDMEMVNIGGGGVVATSNSARLPPALGTVSPYDWDAHEEVTTNDLASPSLHAASPGVPEPLASPSMLPRIENWDDDEEAAADAAVETVDAATLPSAALEGGAPFGMLASPSLNGGGGWHHQLMAPPPLADEAGEPIDAITDAGDELSHANEDDAEDEDEQSTAAVPQSNHVPGGIDAAADQEDEPQAVAAPEPLSSARAPSVSSRLSDDSQDEADEDQEDAEDDANKEKESSKSKSSAPKSSVFDTFAAQALERRAVSSLPPLAALPPLSMPSPGPIVVGVPMVASGLGPRPPLPLPSTLALPTTMALPSTLSLPTTLALPTTLQPPRVLSTPPSANQFVDSLELAELDAAQKREALSRPTPPRLPQVMTVQNAAQEAGARMMGAGGSSSPVVIAQAPSHMRRTSVAGSGTLQSPPTPSSSSSPAP